MWHFVWIWGTRVRVTGSLSCGWRGSCRDDTEPSMRMEGHHVARAGGAICGRRGIGDARLGGGGVDRVRHVDATGVISRAWRGRVRAFAYPEIATSLALMSLSWLGNLKLVYQAHLTLRTKKPYAICCNLNWARIQLVGQGDPIQGNTSPFYSIEGCVTGSQRMKDP